MKKGLFYLLLIAFMFSGSGCIFLLGAGVGAGAYVVSKDTVRADSDKSYASLWRSAQEVAKYRGSVNLEDSSKGYLEAEIDDSRVYIRLTKITEHTSRLQVSARKNHIANLKLAQDIFAKIMDKAK